MILRPPGLRLTVPFVLLAAVSPLPVAADVSRLMIAEPAAESPASPTLVSAGTRTAFLGTLPFSTDADPGDELGASLSAAGDVNGDGVSDVIFSSPGHAGGRGLVEVYLGSASGITFNVSITSATPGSRFGESVCSAGDVNDDGYDDILVGWPLINAGAGQVNVYFGGPGGITGAPTTLVGPIAGGQFGAAVAYGGHLNGDAYGDVAIGAPLATAPGATSESGVVYVYYGSGSGLTVAPTEFRGSALHQRRGTSLAGVGDVNADTYDDLLVGAPYTTSDGVVGKVYLYRGSSTGLSLAAIDSASGSTASARFGFSVASAGDSDADGYMDVVVGAPYAGGIGVETGAAFLIRGTSAGLSATVTSIKNGAQSLGHLGWSVGCAGDLNGDGVGDVAIGQPGFDGVSTVDEGQVYVRFGVRAGTALGELTVTAGSSGAQLGQAVGSGGDLNDDGFSDLAVGAPAFGGTGAVFLFTGKATAARLTSTSFGYSDGVAVNSGISVAMGGDINGDGYDDAVIGTPGLTVSVATEGGVSVNFGQVMSQSGTPGQFLIKGLQSGDRFGESTTIAGDVNGDGYDDVLVGAPGYTNTQAGEGAAFLYYGRATGVDSLPSAQWFGGSPGLRWGSCVAPAGDLNHDGYLDVAVGSPQDQSLGPQRAGRVAIYLGGPGGPSLTSSFDVFGEAQDESLGIAIAAAGDVNGDGIDDLAIGAPGFASATGRVRIVRGQIGPPFAVSTLSSNSGAGGRFGAAVAGRGDIDGDGIADLAVGAPTAIVAGLDKGAVELHLGSLGGVVASPFQSFAGGAAGDLFGWSVSLGDVSADGLSDLAVGSPSADGSAADLGAVDLFINDLGIVLVGPAPRLQRTSALYRGRGTSVACNGDVNGDGFGDVITGAPLSTLATPASGLWEFALGGGAFSTREKIERQLQWISTTPLALGGRSNTGDSFDTVMRARSAVGREEILVEHQKGTVTQAWSTLPVVLSVSGTFGAPDPTNGCFLDMGQGMSGFAAGDAAKWRMRVRTRFPWIPTTPWFSPSGVAATLKHVLMPPNLVAVDPGPASGAGAALELAPARPNPSFAGATFEFNLPRAGRVTFAVYDVGGRLVRDLTPGELAAGPSRLTWDGADANGRPVRAGLYFARLQAAGQTASRSFVRY